MIFYESAFLATLQLHVLHAYEELLMRNCTAEMSGVTFFRLWLRSCFWL